MTKKLHKFQMRCDDVFMENLNWLANELGLSKTMAVEIAVNLYPELVKMYAKHQKLLDELKDKL